MVQRKLDHRCLKGWSAVRAVQLMYLKRLVGNKDPETFPSLIPLLEICISVQTVCHEMFHAGLLSVEKCCSDNLWIFFINPI